MPNAWYMPMILGVYLFLPYVGIALKHIKARVLVLLLTILYVYLFVVPTLSQITILYNKSAITNQLDLSYGGSYYAFYMLIGYCINHFHHDQLSKRIRFLSFFLCLLLLVITVVFEIYSYNQAKIYNVWYDFMTLPVISMFIFLLFEKVNLIVNKKLLVKISDCSFGVFLIHFPILVVLTDTLLPYQQNFFFLLVLTSLVYVLSLAIVLLINRNKKIGILLFYK